MAAETGADMKPQEKTRRLAFCALLSALGVVILYLGAVIEMLDLTVAAIAPLLVMLVIVEVGGYWKWLVYLVTGLLALLLLPQKTGAVIYLLCTGFYPIAKQRIEAKLPRWLGILAKLALFNLSALLIFLLIKAFAIQVDIGMAWYFALALLEVTFLLYDIVLTRVLTAYLFKWRRRFRK